MDEIQTVRCPACRHAVAYGDDVRTVDGRRYHTACVDAHRGDAPASGRAVGILARYIERFSRVLRG